jgi:hypothetical protein
MKISSRSLVVPVLVFILAAVAPAVARAQGCSGKCSSTIDCVRYSFSAFLHHFCLVDESTCECAEYPCFADVPKARSAVLSTPVAARCTSGFDAMSLAPVLQVKAVRLKART